MYILAYIYSFIAGVVAYIIFRTDLLTVILFLIVFETLVYLLYLIYGTIWAFPQRLNFNIFFFLGYFSLFLAYSHLDNDDHYNYNNNIK